ncbi:MAG: hypothetical protein ACE5K4_08895 [Candidatus Hydrothermarchaeota archaeon]
MGEKEEIERRSRLIQSKLRDILRLCDLEKLDLLERELEDIRQNLILFWDFSEVEKAKVKRCLCYNPRKCPA